MQEKQKEIQIKGMSCRSCELRIEKNLKSITGVISVKVNHKNGVARIIGNESVTSEEIRKAVENAGYSLDTKQKIRPPFLSDNPRDYSELALAATIALVGFMVFSSLNTEWFDLSFGNAPSFAVVLLVGLVAGISTCMAMVGGLVLSLGAKFAEKHPGAGLIRRLEPQALFNIGRIVGFAVFGGIIGQFGSAISISGRATGIMILVAGAVMLFFGLQLLKIFPRLDNLQLSLPSSIARRLGILDRGEREYARIGSFLTGALTFFIPCGFTQAMQVYAISSGDMFSGALIMSIFAIGTTPGILALGGIASNIRGGSARLFFKLIGLAVIMLGILNIRGGLNVAGVSISPGINDPAGDNQALILDGVQVIKMEQRANGYFPSSFSVEKDIPVRWEIQSTTEYTCASYINIPDLNIAKPLRVGLNIIEFTPKKPGRMSFTCSMGMYSGTINVRDSAQ